MFERFTDRARRVVVLAQEEARTLNHNYIGTEHLLLGLIHEGEGVAAKVCRGLGVDLDEARTRIRDTIGQGSEPVHGHVPWTPRGKKVLELALREALQLGHNYIGTEHILLAIIREGAGVGAQTLTALGADLDRVRQQTLQLLNGHASVSMQDDGQTVNFPAYSSGVCPKCPGIRIRSGYQQARVHYSKALGRAVGLGEHMRRDCEDCGYSWAEACRTNLMAPNSTLTSEADLKDQMAAVEAEHKRGGAAAS